MVWLVFDGNKTTQNFDNFLHWATRIKARDLVDYKSIYNDSVLETYRLAVAATFAQADLSPFAPPWGDSDSVPLEAEVRAQLAAL